MNTPTPREVFEKWITTDLNYSVATYRNSEEYLSDAVQVAWIAWQEASKELTAAREELKETKKHLKDANRGAEINAHALRINADKLIAVTEQRDEARKLAEKYRNLSCDSQEEADETLLPWENNQPTEQ